MRVRASLERQIMRVKVNHKERVRRRNPAQLKMQAGQISERISNWGVTSALALAKQQRERNKGTTSHGTVPSLKRIYGKDGYTHHLTLMPKSQQEDGYRGHKPHTHRERGGRVRGEAGRADKQHATRPEASHYLTARKESPRSAPMEAKEQRGRNTSQHFHLVTKQHKPHKRKSESMEDAIPVSCITSATPVTSGVHDKNAAGRSRQLHTSGLQVLCAQKGSGAVGATRGRREKKEYNAPLQQKPRTACQAHDVLSVSNSSCDQFPLRIPSSRCGAIAQSRSRRPTKGRRQGA
jgi:hypothetical protein